MKRSIKTGLIKEYDGYTGIIIDENNIEYYFSNDDILNKENLKVKDIVCFLPETYILNKGTRNNARFIRSYEKYKVYLNKEESRL